MGSVLIGNGTWFPPTGGTVPVNTVAPTISGTAQVGQVLTGSDGTWTGAVDSTERVWQLSANGTSGWADIPGATGTTYTPVTGDATQYVRFGVRKTGPGGTSSWAYSSASAQIEAESGTSGVVALAPTVAMLTFPVPSGEVEVERSDGGGPYSVIAWRRGAPTMYFDGTATPGASHAYRVRLRGGGAVVASGSVTMPTLAPTPSAPSALTAIALNAVQVALSWTLNGNRVEDYTEIQQSNDGGSTWATVGRVFRGVRRLTLGGQVAAATPQFRARTVNASGASSFTSPASVTMPAYAGGSVPGAPTMGTALGADESRISVTINLPDEAQLGTVIEYSADAGATWSRIVLTKHHWQAYVIGLTASSTYTFRARTFNTSGYSAYSATITGSTLAAGAVASPTGRNPRICWTPQRQAAMTQMKADYDANPSAPATFGGKLYKAVLDRANTNISGQSRTACPYECGVLYQTTGNATFAQRAYDTLVDFNSSQGDTRNFIREQSTDIFTTYEWLYPALSPAQRENLASTVLKWQSEFTRGINHADGGASFGDDDQATGSMCQLAVIDAAQIPGVPAAGWLALDQTWNYDRISPIGTIAPSTPNANIRSSLADTVWGDYAGFHQGGEWFTSSEYNPGTQYFMMTGLEGVRTARSYEGDYADYHAAMDQSIRDLCRASAYNVVPQFTMSVQWGDDEYPRSFNSTDRTRASVPLNAAGICRGNAVAALAQSFAETMWQATASTLYPSASRTFYMADPYAPKTSYTTLPATHYASGLGQVIHRDGWGANDSLFWGFMPPTHGVEHNPLDGYRPPFWGNFQLYRRAEWSITNPIGYTIDAHNPGAINSVGFAGQGVALESAPGESNRVGYRRVVAQQSGTGYTYIAGLTWGRLMPVSGPGSWNSTPQFVWEHGRSLVYLPSSTKASDVIVVADRTLASNPKVYSGYPGIFANQGGLADVETATALKEWHIHAPMSPNVSVAGQSTWTTEGGQSVKVEHLLPASVNRGIVGPAAFGGFVPSERKYRLTVTPATPWPATTAATWDFFLNVVSVLNSGTVTSTLIQSTAGAEMAGALIQRTGESDAVCMFSAVPSTRADISESGATVFGRVLTSGSTFAFTQASSSCEVRIFDLSTGRAWTYTVNGGASQPLAVSDQGVATITLSGAGAKTLVLA